MNSKPIIFQPWKVKKILDWDWSQGDMQTRRVIKPQPSTVELDSTVRVNGELPSRWFRFDERTSAKIGVVCGRHKYSYDYDKPVTQQEIQKEILWQVSHPSRWVVDEVIEGLCPYGRDELWIRETWNTIAVDERDELAKWWSDVPANERKHLSHPDKPVYRADHNPEDEPYPWIPSIFMPRWASRINLKITRVRVERVTDISEEDAKAEGVTPNPITNIDPYRAAFCELWDKLNEKRGYSWLSQPYVWVIDFKLKALT